ncbi:hypothetical protein [Micromonospora sp. NBC_01796]|uniref:hypothetical protein n=1 Tax=Micromonospora sp. NBC_01796 TaxID=2975987 RepID=UPI002DDB4F81|nr:hypothetical protein [Micromonospora sp. NBC_01796]WSA82870.1 hypothetical protein OIE47_20745 [Micromonospora sp. NBC_01796]
MEITSANGSLPQLIFGLVLWLGGLFLLYWVIRLAVRHAIEDADRRRAAERRRRGV